MNRRQVLLGTAGALAGGNALGAQFDLGTDEEAIRSLAARQRQHWASVTRTTLEKLGWHTAPEVPREVVTYARHAAAMACVESLSTLDAADQTHPAMQELIVELITAIGTGCAELLVALNHVAAWEEVPDASVVENQLEASLLALSTAPVGERSWTLNKNGASRQHNRIRRHGIRAEAGRQARRLERMVNLAGRISAHGGETGVLELADPKLEARVAQGKRKWALQSRPAVIDFLLVLGVVASGLAVLVGGACIFVGIACAIDCGAEALLIALFGGVVFAAGIWGAKRASHALQNPPEDEE